MSHLTSLSKQIKQNLDLQCTYFAQTGRNVSDKTNKANYKGYNLGVLELLVSTYSS